MGIALKVKDKDFSSVKVKKISFVEAKTVSSISAVFVQGTQEFYETSTLNSLRPYLTVTATYSDGTTAVVTNYELSGTLTEGTSTITATYKGKTDTFDVIVSHIAELTSITATYTQGGTLVFTDTPLDSLKANLVVVGNYDDQTTRTIADADYELSGTLTVGTSTITVTYAGKTDTFDVIVSADKVLSSISAVYTQGATIVYETTPLDNLKTDLVVTAHYEDSSTSTLNDNDYTLSGTLTEGTSTVTVSYQGKTTTFSVTVSPLPTLSSIDATYTQGTTIVYPNTPLVNLKSDLVVVAIYSDSSTVTLQPNDYTLSGTLVTGTSTVTVTYEGKTDTFEVVVSQSSEEAETLAFCTAANISDTTVVEKIDTFVKTLKNSTVWNKLTGIYPFVGNDQAGMLVNLKSAGTKDLTANGTITVGSGDYVSGPMTYPNSFTSSDIETTGMSFTAMIKDGGSFTGGIRWVGTSASATATATQNGDFALFGYSSDLTWRLHGTDISTNISSTTSSYVITGNITKNENTTMYKDGVLEATSSTAVTAVGRLTEDYLIDKVNPIAIRFCSIGQALTAQEASVLSSAVKVLKPSA